MSIEKVRRQKKNELQASPYTGGWGENPLAVTKIYIFFFEIGAECSEMEKYVKKCCDFLQEYPLKTSFFSFMRNIRFSPFLFF